MVLASAAGQVTTVFNAFHLTISIHISIRECLVTSRLVNMIHMSSKMPPDDAAGHDDGSDGPPTKVTKSLKKHVKCVEIMRICSSKDI